jgi:hypothetical protein
VHLPAHEVDIASGRVERPVAQNIGNDLDPVPSAYERRRVTERVRRDPPSETCRPSVLRDASSTAVDEGRLPRSERNSAGDSAPLGTGGAATTSAGARL